MPILRHLKTDPKPCRCAMCRLHKQSRQTKQWMRNNPDKTAYLAVGVSTNRRLTSNNNTFKR